MRRVSAVLRAFLTLLAVPASAAAQVDPVAIIDAVDRLYRGESSHAVATMEVVTENWERKLSLEVWSLGTEYMLARILFPRKEAGTATLRAENNIWNYLPKVDRTIKIPSSMMGGSWMGSHFTNDDLVKRSRLAVDYEIDIAGETSDPDGTSYWNFSLLPKPDATVVWGHIEYRVRQQDLMPIEARFFDERGTLARTMEFGDFTEFDGQLLPGTLHMRPSDKPVEHTIVRYEKLDFDVDVSRSFFSRRNLKKAR